MNNEVLEIKCPVCNIIDRVVLFSPPDDIEGEVFFSRKAECINCGKTLVLRYSDKRNYSVRAL
jgi:ribosomal protein S27E